MSVIWLQRNESILEGDLLRYDVRYFLYLRTIKEDMFMFYIWPSLHGDVTLVSTSRSQQTKSFQQAYSVCMYDKKNFLVIRSTFPESIFHLFCKTWELYFLWKRCNYMITNKVSIDAVW